MTCTLIQPVKVNTVFATPCINTQTMATTPEPAQQRPPLWRFVLAVTWRRNSGRIRSSKNASFKAVCRNFNDGCERHKLNTFVCKFLLNPAIKVVAFLDSERRRHVQKGTQPSCNVAIAFGRLDKLSMMQGCPKFDKAELDHMKAVLARAKNDSVQQHCNAVI